MKMRITNVLLCSVLLGVGYLLGSLHLANASFAQTEVRASVDSFQVIAGLVNTSRSSRPVFFVVAADGVAREVKVNGKPLLAPSQDLKLDLGNQIKVHHSGQIQ